MDAEDGISLEERDIARDLIAAVRLGLCKPTGVNHDAARLALADVAAQFGRLLEGHPGRRGEATRDRLGPQQDDVHTAIGLAVVAERPSNPASGVGNSPWLRPWTNAALEIGDDAIGDARVDVRAGFFLFSAHDHDLRWRPRPSRPVTGSAAPDWEVRAPGSARSQNRSLWGGPQRSGGRRSRCAGKPAGAGPSPVTGPRWVRLT